MSEHLSFQLDNTLPEDLQQISELIEKAAITRQDDCTALLALLRLLEQRHREIRETAFRSSLPTSRHSLYTLLRDIEVHGGWPYIQRMKLRSLFENFFPEENAEAASSEEG
jgi:hypothetical protein